MNIQYLGHAGYVVTIDNTRILIDPWFHSAFFGAWFPFPDNSHIEPSVLAQPCDYLYISHTHEDHFDTTFLRHLDPATPVLCPKYRSRALQRQLQALGFKHVIELGHKASFQGTGWSATIYMDTSHKEDSGLLIEAGEYQFLDLNDCNTVLSDLPKHVTFLAAQHSGAMWYPNCYDYPADVMREKTAAVRQQLLETLVHKVRIIEPRYYLPSAGPACFLDPALQHFNDSNNTIFPHWQDIAPAFQQACPAVHVMALLPGDCIQGETITPAPPVPAKTISQYAHDRQAEWTLADDRPVADDVVKDYFAKLCKTNSLILTEDKHFTIATRQQRWSVTLGKNQCEVCTDSEPGAAGYHFDMPAALLQAIVTGQSGWEEALLSMRIKLRRQPDVFDSLLLGLLRYGNHPVQTAQMIREGRSAERIAKDGYMIQRYCPHAGEDLTYATITGNLIECPRHHWQWDLTTGKCVRGGNLPLNCTRPLSKSA